VTVDAIRPAWPTAFPFEEADDAVTR
jgi:hypothetical protein